MAGEVVYGGRVTDSLDHRILMATLRHFVTPNLELPTFVYTPSGTYTCPPPGALGFLQVQPLPKHAP